MTQAIHRSRFRDDVDRPASLHPLPVTVIPLEDAGVTPDPHNARRHTPRNIGLIEDSMQTDGAGRSILVDQDGVTIAGAGAWEAATQVGITRAAIIETDGDTLVVVKRTVTPEQRLRLALADNRATELSSWDADRLKALQAEAPHLLQQLWTEQELTQFFASVRTEPTDGRTDPEAVPDERPTTIQRGDLFALGRHRLLCGDSTYAGDVTRVLAGARPLLMVTDPPYGVAYDPSWRARAGVNLNPYKLGLVANDDRADWTDAWRLFPGEVAYVWHAGLKAGIVGTSLEHAGFGLRAQIMWAKDRLALSRGDYHWQHEPCWYAVRDGAAGHRTDDRTQSTLWTIPARDDAGHGHGTQKPVECMRRPMQNHVASDVYDPFAGSGTTLIAAEQLGRRCLAMEIEPRYVQVAIDRWEAFTGQSAVNVGKTIRA
jgi:DNA modification methylase